MSSVRIRNYQLTISLVFLLDLFTSYLLMKVGITPNYILISRIMTRGVINLIVGLFYLKSLFKFDILNYLKKTLIPITIVIVLLTPIMVYIYNNFSDLPLFIISSLYLITFGGASAYFLILDKKERCHIIHLTKK